MVHTITARAHVSWLSGLPWKKRKSGVFIDMEHIAYGVRCNHQTAFHEYVSTVLFSNIPAPIPPPHQWLQAYGPWAKPPTICFLVDEMQCILDSEGLSQATVPFFRFLGARRILYVGVATCQLMELNCKTLRDTIQQCRIPEKMSSVARPTAGNWRAHQFPSWLSI